MADQFQLVSDVQQTLKRSLFGPGWIHLGTAKLPMSNRAPERYFMLLMRAATSEVYIEEYVDYPEYFKKISQKEQKLWNDLYMFFAEHKLINVAVGKEFKIAKKE